jgi:group I intron endonuclease
MKKHILKPGIYQFTNKVNGKRYVGSSKNIHYRKLDHLSMLRNGVHNNLHFQRSFSKHKEDCFHWEVLEYCSLENMLDREQYYLDFFKPEYNILTNARNSSGIKRSQETRDKISRSRKGKCAGKNHPNYGKKRSKEIIDKMSVGAKERCSIYGGPMKGKKHREESKAKMRANLLGTSRRAGKVLYEDIQRINIETGEIQLYKTAQEAAKAINRSAKPDSSKIIRACKEPHRTAFGYKWSFTDKSAKVKLGEFRESPDMDNPEPSINLND